MPVFNGDDGPNTLDGSSGADTINGGGGADRLFGGLGADVIVGGDGDDALWGYGFSTPAADGVAIPATRIAAGLERPVFAAFAPVSQRVFNGAPAPDANRLFVVESHTGQIEIVDLTTNTLRATPFLDLPDSEIGQGNEEGLLGLAFHPDYASNGKFYVYLVNTAGNLELRQYSVSSDPDIANPSGDVILTIPHPTFSNHNGGWIGFGPDGFLYIAVGDGGSGGDPSNNAQNTNVLLGKMLRIDVNSDAFPSDPLRDYAIPGGNPFAASAGADEIWSFGLRNPWRNAFDIATGDLYIGDVGQDAREEVNFQPAGAGGRNYGWRVMEGDVGVNDPAFTAPVRVYAHDVTTGGFSITGGYVYRGPATAFDGAYFYADFISNNLWTAIVSGGSASPSIERDDNITANVGTFDQVASFALDAAQRLYAVGLHGELFRIELPADRTDAGNALFGGAGNDRLYGGSGADLLNGGDGADLMDGGAGDDIYEVTDTLDTVIELPGAGGDWVRVVIPWFMLPANVENVANFLANANTFAAIGNGAANFMRGGAGQDFLYGGAGADRLEGFDGDDSLYGELDDDYLWGGAGRDLLSGGAGVNVLEGATGDDTYEISSASTVAIEQPGEGLDVVRTDTLAALALGANLEILLNFGAQTFVGYGNDLANFLRGGEGADTMFGYGGADRVEGWGGDDMLNGGANDDFIWGGAGNDAVVGEDGADVLEGFDGSDALVGGDGADVMTGGRGIDGYYGQGGDDVFVFNDADLQAGVQDYLWDYANTADNNDQIRFFGIVENAVSYLQQGANVIISIQVADGTATILAADTTVAQVQSDVLFG